MTHQTMYLGFIPARSGSKGIPGKNIRPLLGKPLIAYAIECGLKCPSIDHLIVSTDSMGIAQIAKKYGADVPFLRPKELAEDITPMLPTMQHGVKEAEKYYGQQVKALVLLDPTGPLRTVKDVERAIAIFKKSDCDAVVSANKAHRSPYFNMVERNGYYVCLAKEPKDPVDRRQDSPDVFDLNTVVWVYSRDALMKIKKRLPERTLPFLIPSERAIDIDTELDIKILEFMMTKNKGPSLQTE